MEDSIWYITHTPVYSISSFILRRRRCRPLTYPNRTTSIAINIIQSNRMPMDSVQREDVPWVGGRRICNVFCRCTHIIRRRYVRRSSAMDTFRRRRLFEVCTSMYTNRFSRRQKTEEETNERSMYSHLLFAIILVGHDAMNFGSNSTVRHESFSTASRVGVVAAIDGWMRA